MECGCCGEKTIKGVIPFAQGSCGSCAIKLTAKRSVQALVVSPRVGSPRVSSFSNSWGIVLVDGQKLPGFTILLKVPEPTSKADSRAAFVGAEIDGYRLFG